MKNIFDHPAVKRVSAWAICYQGDIVGKIIVAYPLDGAGIVRAQVNIWDGPFRNTEVLRRNTEVLRGKARGYGWDKTSGAVADALHVLLIGEEDLSGRGMGAVAAWFDSYGYSLTQIL